ncbi:MAG: DUF1294 domain-containing protein [Bacteroides sp.]|nr:DUF1294 domain-containing protein [Bacteroides sp.]
MPPSAKAQLIYFIAVSAAGLMLTVYDKIAAKLARRHRVKENVLLTVGILGGALVMYAAMLLIRHKTRKRKFAVGFPIIIVLQAAACAVFYLVLIPQRILQFV